MPVVLVVEDEPAILLAITRTLEASRHEVLAVRSGTAAQQTLRERRIDLAILDINLPDITGWDVVRAIHETPGPPVPIVVISAVMPRVARLRQCGVSGVLLKPFPMDALLRLATRLTGTEPRQPISAGFPASISGADGQG